MKNYIAAAAIFVSGMLLPQAWASPVVASYTFTSPAGNAGTVQTYTNNGISIVASGFSGISTTNVNSATSLFDNTTVGNSGLGLANDYYNANKAYEIPNNEFVQLDFSQVPNLSTATISFQMTDVVVGWRIFGSNTAGVLGTLIQSGSDTNLDTLIASASTYKYVDVMAAANCETVLNNLQISTTTSAPEPATSALMGFALVGMAIVVKKVRARA